MHNRTKVNNMMEEVNFDSDTKKLAYCVDYCWKNISSLQQTIKNLFDEYRIITSHAAFKINDERIEELLLILDNAWDERYFIVNEIYQRAKLSNLLLAELYYEKPNKNRIAQIEKAILEDNLESEKYINTKMEQNNIYQHLVERSRYFKNNIFSKNLESLTEIKFIGEQLIQKHLAYCMEIFLKLKPRDFEEDYYQYYTNIAEIFVEFWFAEGLSLNSQNEDKIDSQLQKNLEVMIFLFLMNTDKTSNLANKVYTLIFNAINLEYQISEMHDISLEQLAREKPKEFINLFNYLFQANHVFSRFLVENMHSQVSYHRGIFYLYASTAYQQLFNQTKDKRYQNLKELSKAYAVQNFITCYHSKIKSADIKLKEIAPDDFTYNLYIKIISPETNPDWILREKWSLDYQNSNFKIFEDEYIRHQIKQGNEGIFVFLLTLAKFNNKYIEPLVLLLIEAKQENPSFSFCTALHDFLKKNDDPKIKYLDYILLKNTSNCAKDDEKYLLLSQSANAGYEQAKIEIERIIYKKDKHRDKMIDFLIQNLSKNTKVSLDILLDVYKNFNITVRGISLKNWLDIFLPHSLTSSEQFLKEKAISELQQYISHYTNLSYINAYEAKLQAYQVLDILLNYHDRKLTVDGFLIDFLVKEHSPFVNYFNIDEFKTIKYLRLLGARFETHYKHDESGEKNYYYYLIKTTIREKDDFDFLYKSCRLEYKPAILKLTELFKTLNKNHDDYQKNLSCMLSILKHTAEGKSDCNILAAKSLFRYYAIHCNTEIAEVYFKIYDENKVDTESIFWGSDLSQTFRDHFVTHCSAEIYALIPDKHKTDLSSQRRHVGFFDKNSLINQPKEIEQKDVIENKSSTDLRK